MSQELYSVCVFFQSCLDHGADLANAYIETAEQYGIDLARAAFYSGGFAS